MEKSPRLSSEWMALCGQPGHWRDLRPVQTLAWMVVGLLQAAGVTMPTCIPFVHGRARDAQSTQRRFKK